MYSLIRSITQFDRLTTYFFFFISREKYLYVFCYYLYKVTSTKIQSCHYFFFFVKKNVNVKSNYIDFIFFFTSHLSQAQTLCPIVDFSKLLLLTSQVIVS